MREEGGKEGGKEGGGERREIQLSKRSSALKLTKKRLIPRSISIRNWRFLGGDPVCRGAGNWDQRIQRA